MKRGFSFAATAASAFLAGCTLVQVDTDDAPPRVESGGLIDGHLALGVREDDELLQVDLFDGRSSGALGEITLWKLLRVEVGLLGLGVGVGPFDAALGFGLYDPDLPEFEQPSKSSPAAPAEEHETECELERAP